MELANLGGGGGCASSASSSASMTSTTTTRRFDRPISDPSLLPRKRSGLFGASSNLVNSIVGAGIIGIPYAFRESGLVAGAILLVAVGFFTDKSLRMLVDLAFRSPSLWNRGVRAYDDLMGLPFGNRGRWFVQASMLVTAYGAMVAYLLIIKDTLPVLLGLVDDGDVSVGGFVERELVMVIASALVALPLSMKRDFSSLSFTSGLSVGADLAMVGVVVAVVTSGPIPENLREAGGFGSLLSGSVINGGGFFVGFGVLTIAMCCQHSAFIVVSSLERPTVSRWAAVSGVSLVASVACCLVLGVAGYLGYLDKTRGDVLNNLDAESRAANAARALLAVTMFFTYPMESFVARHVLVQLLWDGDLDGYLLTPEESLPSDGVAVAASNAKPPKRKACFCLTRRHQATLAIYAATLVPALFVDDLGPVLSITGAVGGCCLAYIGPGLAYLGVFGRDLLVKLARILEARNRRTTPPKVATSASVADLPVAGDAEARMEDDIDNGHNDFDPRALFLEGEQARWSKPLWWYAVGTPLWIRIAAAGWTGMEASLEAHNVDSRLGMRPVMSREGCHDGENETAEEPHQEEVVDAHVRDFGIAVFFLVFGSVALVAGVASNVLVWIKGRGVAPVA